MSPLNQGNNLLGQGSGSSDAANHSKAAMTAASSPAGGGGNCGGIQRFPGRSQQLHPSGATPTLNQLLTSPSTTMRGYGGGYPDYNPSAQQQPSTGLAEDMGSQYGSQYGSSAHDWGRQQRNQPTVTPGSTGPGSGRTQVNNTLLNYGTKLFYYS